MPNSLRTVQDLRNEIEYHPENEMILNEVLKDVELISSRADLLMKKSIKEIYEELNSSTDMEFVKAYIEMVKGIIIKKMNMF